MRRLLSTTGATMLLCVFGCGLLFLPWTHRLRVPVDPTLQAKGELKATGPFHTESFPGYADWLGTGCAAAFFGVLVFLLITGSLEPVPWWRSAAVMATGTGIIAGVLFGMRYPPGGPGTTLEPGWLVSDPSLGVATYTAFGLAVALVLLAAIELRWSIARRRDRQKLAGELASRANSAEPSAAADGGRISAFGNSTSK